MPTWAYDASQYSKEDFALIPEGEYRVKIVESSSKQSSTLKDMIVLKLKVEGQPGHIFYNLVLDPWNRGMTNQNLGRIYDSFRLPEPPDDDIPYWSWAGAYGAAKVRHKEYRGKLRAEIESFLTQEKQAELGMKPIKPQALIVPEPEIMDLSSPFEDEPEEADIPF